jgi:fibronectin-binding autotransporter adhesin
MANRFWVGGTATWDATAGTKWATTSGGAGGSAVPTAADDVFLDASSGASTVTSSTTSCRSLNFTGFTGTFIHTAGTTLTIGDATAGASNIALKLVSGMTYTLGNAVSSGFKFASTSATTQTIDSGGKTLAAVTFDGVGGSWQLISGLTAGASATVTLTNGTFDTNGQTCSWGGFALGVGTKTLNMGASSVTVTASSGTPWSVTTNSAGFTLNAGTSTITNTNTNTTMAFGNNTYYNIIAPAATVTYSGNFTCNNFTCTPAAGSGTLIILGGNLTVTGLLTLQCSDSATIGGRGWLSVSTTPTGVATRTITLSNTPVLQNFDFSDMTFAGTGAPYSGTNLGDGLGNSGLTFPTRRTLYWVGTATSWATLNRWTLTSGGVTGGVHIPLAHDDVVFDANSAVTSGSLGVNRVLCRNIDMSLCAQTFTWALGLSPSTMFGNLALKAGMTVNGAGQLAFCGRSSHTITTNGVTITATSWAIWAGNTGSYALQDDLTGSSTFAIIYGNGGLNFNNKNVNIGAFTSTQTTTRSWQMGSGTLTLTGTGGVISVSDVSLTFDAGTSLIKVTDTSATAKTINFPNGKTMYDLQIVGGSGGYVLEWAGATSGHFGSLHNLTVSGPAAITTPAGQITTITGSTTLNTTGGAISWVSATPGTKIFIKPTIPVSFGAATFTDVQFTYLAPLTDTAVSTSSVVKVVGKSLTASTAIVPTAIKTMFKTLALAASGIPTLAKSRLKYLGVKGYPSADSLFFWNGVDNYAAFNGFDVRGYTQMTIAGRFRVTNDGNCKACIVWRTTGPYLYLDGV